MAGVAVLQVAQVEGRMADVVHLSGVANANLFLSKHCRSLQAALPVWLVSGKAPAASQLRRVSSSQRPVAQEVGRQAPQGLLSQRPVLQEVGRQAPQGLLAGCQAIFPATE